MQQTKQKPKLLQEMVWICQEFAQIPTVSIKSHLSTKSYNFCHT